MEHKISENIISFIKKAFPELLKNNGNVFLDKPFGGFFISFDKQQEGNFIKEYSAQEIGAENDGKNIYLFCKDIFG
ncbi:MAG: hypothetical protein UR60_C0045G0006 [Candidatus Moranbacteria bacterium GW2011_GWF2_34_56]|nr:MAG: hypothetical protein UR51_C0006G0056 [Candidatus Moranbacteria bacterium GW2011_GWF1_34_10]KKP63327.1 MAG: hypothetical protein UR60_C0045G0006 [Candidatus Moranbacteria bacterium GW2011_GWF2_34_56]HBI16699.1 hypothetical protein [Candidatus Moranbacteria bacterium]